ncbi:MAG TPA: hypothetical protein VIH10_11270, partial [Kribbella sp.]
MNVTAVVVRASDEAVLMLPSGLPQVDLADKVWFPNVEPTLRALQEQHGIEAAVLTCLDEEPLTYLMLLTGEAPADAYWMHDRDVSSPDSRAWTKPDWYDEALPWIAEHVAATGPWSQVRSWGLSNVLRIPTAEGDVYFKALAHSST